MGLTPEEFSAGAEKKELTPEQRGRRKQNAMAKALMTLTGLVNDDLVAPGAHMVFDVIGSQGTIYDVVATDEGIQCPCKAGEYGTPCYHVSLVELRLALSKLVGWKG